MNNREFYRILAASVRRCADVRLYTILSGGHLGQKALYAGEDLTVQQEALRPFWLEAAQSGQFEKVPCSTVVGETTVLAENLANRARLVICGGGHISQPLAQMGTMLDFEVAVMDDRAEFANSARFPTAQPVLCAAFGQAFQQLEPCVPNTYYVVVTRGHSADRQCLEEILRRNPSAAYIGMIGSRRKVAVVMEQMAADGWPNEQLARIYAPIGLKIGAQTPAEIAVCIAAQLVQVRRAGFAEGCLEASMLAQLENEEQPMVLATIITKEGSAPRDTGAKMLLNARGAVLSGSIGGGAGEGQVCAMAERVLQAGRPEIAVCNMTNDDAKKAGMVCGGTVTVLVEPLNV